MKILAVDDEPLFLEILDISLTGLGYTDVSYAYSAKEALRELEVSQEKFDCILLDIRMPGMEGVELCRRIRLMDRYRRAPIMMVTSMSDRHYIDTAFAAGATDYLSKPIDTTELKARMAMMERLVIERLRNQLLEYRVSAATNVVELKFELATPVMVDGFDRLIEYLALENYLLSLGIKDSYDASAFAISISNAASIFSCSSPVDFMNMLGDVAICIEDALKAIPGLVSYAGNGNFVVVTSGSNRIDTELVADTINIGLEEFAGIYQSDSIPRPTVAVGTQVRKALFSRVRPVQFLECAVAAIEPKPASQMRRLTKLAWTTLQDLLPALQPLRARFVEMSIFRSTDLSKLRNRILLGQAPTIAMSEIGDIVHKISGVAPTLGFPEWGRLAAELDAIINAMHKQEIGLEEAWRHAELPLEALICAMSG